MDDSSAAETKEVEVYELLAVCLEQISGLAWVKLGLQPDPLSQKMGQDLAQAKIAIDAVSALAPIMEADLNSEDRAQIQTLVRNLKLNFVTKSKEIAE